jgi:hypothetical protein
LIRFSRVSNFLADSTQHIHSLRASGVISPQAASAFGCEIKAAFKSPGKSWTTPPGIDCSSIMQGSNQFRSDDMTSVIVWP